MKNKYWYFQTYINPDNIYLLHIDPRPWKQVHNLRMVSALLVSVSQTKICVASPSVHFSRVCDEIRSTKWVMCLCLICEVTNTVSRPKSLLFKREYNQSNLSNLTTAYYSTPWVYISTVCGLLLDSDSVLRSRNGDVRLNKWIDEGQALF